MYHQKHYMTVLEWLGNGGGTDCSAAGCDALWILLGSYCRLTHQCSRIEVKYALQHCATLNDHILLLSRVSFQEKMQVVHQFMFDHKLGQGLLKRVDHYFTLLWGQYK